MPFLKFLLKECWLPWRCHFCSLRAVNKDAWGVAEAAASPDCQVRLQLLFLNSPALPSGKLGFHALSFSGLRKVRYWLQIHFQNFELK